MSNFQPPPGGGYPGAPYGAPSYAPPGSYPPGAGGPSGSQPPGSGYPGYSGAGAGGPPGSAPPGGMYSAPPGGFAPPPGGGGGMNMNMNRPPPAMMGGPPGGMSGGGGPASFNPGSAPVPPPKSSVQFFSTAGGAPVPASNTPPTSMGGGFGGPPSGMGGPPMGGGGGGFGMMPPPPSGGGMMMGGPPMGGAAPGMPGGAGGGGGGAQFYSAPGVGGGVGVGGGAGGGMMGGMMSMANSMAGMPSAFGSSTNLSGGGANAGMMMGGMTGVPGTGNPADAAGGAAGGGGGVAGAAAGAGAPLPLIDEMDLSIQCNPQFLRASVGKIVSSQSAANASRVPLGLVCKPMWGDKGNTNADIEVVDFGSTGIVRCKRCRTYINPFVTWADNGRRWRCNICGMLNDVPSTYFSHLDNTGQRRDKDQRPELSNCSVEFVAPGDYMVRPPQPPVYFFVIDVSEASVSSGMIQAAVNAIKVSLDELPGNSRTQIGFVTFDSHIHFYNLKSTLAAPQMLVVSDVSDVIMPLPEDLMVNLADSRSVVDALLDALPSMFRSNGNTSTCTGPALLAAKRVMQHLGGKLCLFQSSLPNIGEGSLKIRENPRMLGTDKEHTLVNAEDPWYKTNAIDFSRLQISVDTFLFSGQYTDLATLSVLSKYTAGSTYYYPGFHGPRDGPKFEHDLHHDLTRATAFEAVMRVRATRGLRFSNFYGNYFVRGTDLLALPNCTADSSFSLDIAYDETQLSAQAITIQAALLYTSSAGERRIRVHTMVLPVTHSASEMVESLDIDCAMNLISKQATDIALKTGFDNARQRVHQTTVEILRATRGGGVTGGGGNMSHYGMTPQQAQYMQQQQQAQANAPIPNSLLLLPLYSMSLQKSLVLRGGSDVRVDERAYFQHLLYNMDIDESKVFIYPRMFSLHDMAPEHGTPYVTENPDEEPLEPTAGTLQVRLPSILNLSYERLTSDGIFLLENGFDLFMWIGRGVDPNLLTELVGCASLEGVDMNAVAVRPDNGDYAARVQAVVSALREDRSRYMQLHFIREGDGYAEAYFARYLIEDRANFSGGNLSYMEYHAHITRAISGLPG